MKESDLVLLNLRDSVSRIVDNLGFTSIEVGAHAKLVGIVADKLSSMSNTCRVLVENAGKTGVGLIPEIDMKHLFRIHRIDLRGMTDYIEQVQPFPPLECEIHGGPAKKKVKVQNCEDVLESGKSVRKHPRRPISELPVFDDLDAISLGFSFDSQLPTSSKSAPTVFPTPPPPPPPIYQPPLPSLNFPRFDFPIFDPEVPPPNVGMPIPIPHPPLPSVGDSPVKLKVFNEMMPAPVKYKPPKWSDLEKQSIQNNNNFLPAQKMTKKRLLQSNYERRLRNEQAAKEERKKERMFEKRRMEEARRSVEREQQDSHERLIEEIRRTSRRDLKKKKKRRGSPRWQHFDEEYEPPKKVKLLCKLTEEMLESIAKSNGIEELDRKPEDFLKVYTAGNEHPANFESSEPLLKMRITFKPANKGFLIKKVLTTKYQHICGIWKPIEDKWSNSRGVYSETEFPHKKRPSFEPPIPKLRLIKLPNNTYTRA